MSMEQALRPENALLLREMSSELNDIVERRDKADAARQLADK